GQPTVILAHTIKGWTLGPDFEGRNATHQMKKLTVAELKEFRDRLYLEIPDSALEAELPPYYHPGENSDEIQYMKERRAALGGYRLRHPRPADEPGVRVLLDVRLAADRRPDVGVRRPARPRLPARRHRRPHHAHRRGPPAQRRALGAAGVGQPGLRGLRRRLG